jgi:hypothetical protein
MIGILQQISNRPLYQAAFFILIMVLMFLGVRPAKSETLWMMAGATYALFILLNAIMIWFSDSRWTYFFVSLLVSVAYLIVANSLIKGYSNFFKTDGSDESSMIFLVIMYHPVALLAGDVCEVEYY